MSVGEFSPPPPEGPFPPSTWNQSRVGFPASGHQRDSRPGLASDSYDSPLFKARKHYVEQSCDYYAILSGVHRLLLPNDLTTGGDVSLLRVRHSVRRFWTEQAYFSIFYRISPGTTTTIEFHGSPAYADFGLVEILQRMGARVERPTLGFSLSEQYEFYRKGLAMR